MFFVSPPYTPQVKCYLGMSSLMEDSELEEAMSVIESTNLKYFTKEMISEFMALKGTFLAQIGRWVSTTVHIMFTIYYVHM